MQTNLAAPLLLYPSSQLLPTNFGKNIYSAWEWAVPYPEDRIRFGKSNAFPLLCPALVLFGSMCLLVRRPNTRLYRLALMPFVSAAVWRLAFMVQWYRPHVLSWNVVATAGSLAILTRSIEFGLAPNGIERIGEQFPGEAHLSPKNSWFDTLYWAVYDATDIGCNVRGIGWKFGTGDGVRIPPHTRPIHDRKAWLWSTFKTFFITYFVFDLMANVGEWTNPEFKHQIGFPIWYPELPPVLRYTASTAITGILCIVAASYMNMCYEMASLVGVGVLRHDPVSWPPLFGQPWFAESIHEFWAFHWHQLMRRTLMVTVGHPLGSVFGQVGAMIGVFVASGVYHSIMLNGDGATGFSWTTLGLFSVQSLGMLMERGFRKVTGKRVGGTWGNVWTFLWIAVVSQPAENTWLQRQDLGVRLIPESVSLIAFLYKYCMGGQA